MSRTRYFVPWLHCIERHLSIFYTGILRCSQKQSFENYTRSKRFILLFLK